jgi:hypothetical protein
MADLDRADLLAKAQELLNRPTTDEALSTTIWYSLLTSAQKRAFGDLLPRIPDAMVGSPTLLSTADGGETYTFGAGVYPVGHAQVFASESDIPDCPLEEGIDYLYEGSSIRIPNNATRTFGDGPYARWVSLPGVIDGSTEPTLIAPARMLIVYDAVKRAALRLRMDASQWEADYQQELHRVSLMFRTAVHPRMRRI